MQIEKLQADEVLKIWCKSEKSTYLKDYTKSTFICWVDELVAVGQVIRFTDYTNYADDWTVVKVEAVEKKSECLKRYGEEKYFLHHIEAIDEMVESNPTQTSAL